MARRKSTIPERSKIERAGTHAFARRTKGSDDSSGDKPSDGDGESEEGVKDGDPAKDPATAEGTAVETQAASTADADPAGAAPTAPAAPTADERAPADADGDGPRMRFETVMMSKDAALGAPPDLPSDNDGDGLSTGAAAAAGPAPVVEDPTNMPGPRNIPAGNPNDPAAAPGFVPKGDSRSLRRGSDFALVYRMQTFLISRFGVVGTRGQWRVVEYPTSGAAGHSYARETSRYMSDGYSDYRG